MVECTADFPEDTLWGEDGEIDQVGGSAVAKAIAAGLAGRGVMVTDPIVDEDHGWCFDAKLNERSFWVLASYVGEYIISVERRGRRFLDWLMRKPDDEYAAFLETLHEVLVADGRFHQLKWFVEGKYAEPASRPTG
jgi:hypothetical protein